jgi:hypothetical protein
VFILLSVFRLVRADIPRFKFGDVETSAMRDTINCKPLYYYYHYYHHHYYYYYYYYY